MTHEFREVSVGRPEGREYLEEQGIEGKKQLQWIFKKKLCGNVDWIDLAQDKVNWR